MADLIISIWFFVILIPSFYLVYTYMQCINFEKFIKPGRSKQFKVLYILICFVIAFLIAFAFTTILEKLYSFVSNIQ